MTKAIVSTSVLFSAVAACYVAADTFAAKVDALRKELKVQRVPFEPKAIKAALMPATAKHYGVTLKAKERGEGMTWDMADPKSNTAKVQNDRLAKAVLGDAEGKDETQEIEIPAELLVAAEKMAKLAQAYEGARSLASKALAQAFAK